MDMFLQLSLLKFFLFFYFLFISRFGKQQQMNGTFWKTWRTAEMVDKGLDGCTNTEEHLELSSVWRRLGPVSKRCQTLEVGGSSGASSLHSRARAWDRMPTTALWSALSSSHQEGQQRNERKERGWGRGRQKNNSAWLRPDDRNKLSSAGRQTILLKLPNKMGFKESEVNDDYREKQKHIYCHTRQKEKKSLKIALAPVNRRSWRPVFNSCIHSF